ncbi:alpha/beta hydrolase [Cellulomonas sp. PhB143]|uniref:alpha/beta hydrolase n=1 Tax=Cellulomonas sp. PhB143 TaxID=2485186 RepID=UPI000F4792BF|nr:alpha/beta hydrolase [Cellulomonas sp. PhB143]ROS73382.1 alpha/beta hydrolase family protein [Cellulomonas sp. PhB143]
MEARGLTRFGLFLLGTSLLATSVWVGLRSGDALARNHWLYPVLLVVAFTVGGVLIGYLLVLLYRDGGGRDPQARPPLPVIRPPLARWSLGAAWTVVAVALVGLTWSVLRFQPMVATADALAVYAPNDVVGLQDDEDWYAFVPRGGDSGGTTAPVADRSGDGGPDAEQVAATGLAYYPDERVDSRALAPLLRPVAEAGYVVVVMNEPLGVASTDPDQALQAFAEFPQVTRWVVAGHGAGGEAAAAVAAHHSGSDGPVRGLLLQASSPTTDASDADVLAASVWGTQDGVVPPARIAASRDRLPADTDFVRIFGASHAQFADYGAQGSDGDPTLDDKVASAQIRSADLAFMDRVAVAKEKAGKDGKVTDGEGTDGTSDDAEKKATTEAGS